MNHSKNSRSQRGFTLVELVVALAVLALLFLLIQQGLNLSQRAWAIGTVTASNLDEVNTVQQALRQHLRQITPWSAVYPGLSGTAVCRGDEQEIDFMAPTPGEGSEGAYRLKVDVASQGQELSAEWCDGFPNSLACDRGPWHREVLLSKIQEAMFSYYRKGESAENAWSSNWSDCSQPPELIRLSIRFPSGDRRIWPDFVARPRLTAGPDCVFDVVAMACRRQ